MEQEKEGVRKNMAGVEGNKSMQRNEVDLDKFSPVLLDSSRYWHGETSTISSPYILPQPGPWNIWLDYRLWMLPSGQGGMVYPAVGLSFHNSPPHLLKESGGGDKREWDYLSKCLSNCLSLWLRKRVIISFDLSHWRFFLTFYSFGPCFPSTPILPISYLTPLPSEVSVEISREKRWDFHSKKKCKGLFEISYNLYSGSPKWESYFSRW